ncbi:hypothetical protein HYQ46_007816 [Verticillium longisporum]|nr:hypothetical protein HYQ46_007816 [Verticillium longisporum]
MEHASNTALVLQLWVEQSEEVFRTEGPQAMDRYGAKTRLNSGPRRSLFSPVGAFKPAMKFLEARDKDNKTDMDKWRPVVKGILTIAEEEEKEGGDDPNKDLDGLRNAKRKAAGRAAALRLFDCLCYRRSEISIPLGTAYAAKWRDSSVHSGHSMDRTSIRRCIVISW